MHAIVESRVSGAPVEVEQPDPGGLRPVQQLVDEDQGQLVAQRGSSSASCRNALVSTVTHPVSTIQR